MPLIKHDYDRGGSGGRAGQILGQELGGRVGDHIL
jgi:hypothetical protein